MEINEFLRLYFSDSDLRKFLDDKMGFTAPRGKESVIESIFENERFHPDLLYSWLDSDDMRDLCEDMRLPVYGSKKDRWKRILETTNEFDGQFGGLIERNETSFTSMDKNKKTFDSRSRTRGVIDWYKTYYRELDSGMKIIINGIAILSLISGIVITSIFIILNLLS